MATESYSEHVRAFAKVGELFGLLVVSWLTGRSAEPAATAIDVPVAGEGDEPLTRKEAAKYLKISVSLLDQWRQKGAIKPIPGMGDRVVRYRKSDLNRIIKRKRE